MGPNRVEQRGRAARNAYAILVLLLLGLMAGCGGETTARTSTPTAQPTATPTRTPLFKPGDSWVKGDPAFAETVAFASSEPDVGYTCGVTNRESGGTGPVALGVTRDGGRTWQTLATSAKAADCMRIRVSPTNSRYVAFFTNSCYQGCAGLENPRLYFTRDGGETWSTASLPSTMSYCSSPLDVGFYFEWAGVTLFAMPCAQPLETPRRPHFLAASVDGAPFAWADGGLLSGPYAASAPNTLVAVGATLYVSLGASLAKTSDGGATWTHLPADAAWPHIDALPVPEGAPLLAIGVASNLATSARLLRSNDGGATWARLPDPPNGASLLYAFEIPDQTVYIWSICCSAVQRGVYKLTPGATGWTFVAPREPLPPEGALDAVSWDATGAAVALWGGPHQAGGGLWLHPA